MGTDVAERIHSPVAPPSQQHGFAQQLVALQLAGLELGAHGREPPAVVQEAAPEGRGLGVGARLGSGVGQGVGFRGVVGHPPTICSRPRLHHQPSEA
jgi:hypothetical protein